MKIKKQMITIVITVVLTIAVLAMVGFKQSRDDSPAALAKDAVKTVHDFLLPERKAEIVFKGVVTSKNDPHEGLQEFLCDNMRFYYDANTRLLHDVRNNEDDRIPDTRIDSKALRARADGLLTVVLGEDLLKSAEVAVTDNGISTSFQYTCQTEDVKLLPACIVFYNDGVFFGAAFQSVQISSNAGEITKEQALSIAIEAADAFLKEKKTAVKGLLDSSVQVEKGMLKSEVCYVCRFKYESEYVLSTDGNGVEHVFEPYFEIFIDPQTGNISLMASNMQ